MKNPEDTHRSAGERASTPFYMYRFGDVVFDEAQGSLAVGGVDVEIEPRPLQLLAELLQRPNEVITKDDLLELLWKGRPTVDNVLPNAVTKLRRALGVEAAGRIINVPRIGYKFTGALERIAVGQQPPVDTAFAAGDPVVGNEDYRLETWLGRSPQSLVWRAGLARLETKHVFKFAVDGERLRALKREYTLYRVLRAELGGRDDFAQVVAVNFSVLPYWIECEDGGQDLIEWAREGHLAALSLQERVALFLHMARAVSAAHGVGVLHKDLKPANVLVARQGEAWVVRLTDFGSSRLLEPGRLATLGVTAFGLTMTQGIESDSLGGTPFYLAPELLAGRSPTTQSDLYALGLMLYQMIVGDLRRPMSTGWQRDIDDALLVEDLSAATEGRPEDRLASVAELVCRLESLEPRRARRALAAEATQRGEALLAEAERRRARRPWLITAFAALSVGMVASLWSYHRAETSLVAERVDAARAEAFNDFLTKDVLQSRDVLHADTRKPVSLLEVLRNASSHISERFKGQPLVEAAVRSELAQTYERMASTTEAYVEFDKALALATPVVKPDDKFLLSLRFAYADMLMRTYNPGDAERAAQQVRMALAAADAKVLQANPDLAFMAAKELFELKKRDGANPQAVESGLRMMAAADASPRIDPQLRAEARQSFAELYLSMGEQSKADALLQQVLDSPIGSGEVAEVARARAVMAIASAHRDNGRPDLAETELRALADRLQITLGVDSLQYGLARNEEARSDVQHGESSLAVQALRQALAAFSAALGPEHQYTTVSIVNLAEYLTDIDQDAEALGLVDRVAPWFATHTTHRYVLLDVVRAAALNGLGRYPAALASLDQITAKDFELSPDVRWFGAGERARALVGMHRRPEGVALMKSAIAAGSQQEAGGARLALYRHLLEMWNARAPAHA